MSHSFEQRCLTLLSNLDLAQAKDVVSIRPLTGGVASDIGVVSLSDRKVCVKFALAKLKVAEDWRAPVHRNKSEYAWLAAARHCVPENVPQLFGWSEKDNGFAMEFLEGKKVYLWKQALLSSAPDRNEAIGVAEVLGRIHAMSAAAGFDSRPFHNRDDFRALRLEPYLSFTASRHPDVQKQFSGLVDELYNSDIALVHGDVSPKNILFRQGKPIILDAECATMGDPCFDVSFCINHLILKAAHIPSCAKELLGSVEGFWKTYAEAVNWEDLSGLEKRIAKLIPALMLARVDGKSPVEYLSDTERATIRVLALSLIKQPVESVPELVSAIAARIVSE